MKVKVVLTVSYEVEVDDELEAIDAAFQELEKDIATPISLSDLMSAEVEEVERP